MLLREREEREGRWTETKFEKSRRSVLEETTFIHHTPQLNHFISCHFFPPNNASLSFVFAFRFLL